MFLMDTASTVARCSSPTLRSKGRRSTRELYRLPSSVSGTGYREKTYEKGGYFNRHEVQRSPRLLLALYPFRRLSIGIWTLFSAFRHSPFLVFLSHLREWITWPLRGRRDRFRDYRSLRQVVRELAPAPADVTEESMLPLRLGR